MSFFKYLTITFNKVKYTTHENSKYFDTFGLLNTRNFITTIIPYLFTILKFY